MEVWLGPGWGLVGRLVGWLVWAIRGAGGWRKRRRTQPTLPKRAYHPAKAPKRPQQAPQTGSQTSNGFNWLAL